MSAQATIDTDVMNILRTLVDNAATGTVFGTPIVKDGVTLLPVALVRAGGGGGSGDEQVQDKGKKASGNGGGVGLLAKPLGVYVIANGKVSWRPAVDINKIIMGGQIVMAIALLTLRAFRKARRAA